MSATMMEEQSDRKRTLIIAAIIFLVISVVAGLVWYFVMAERWKTGGPVQVGRSVPLHTNSLLSTECRATRGHEEEISLLRIDRIVG